MKKITILVLLVFLTIASLFATDTKSNMAIFSLEMGTGASFDISTSSISATQTVSAVFGLNEFFLGGFSLIKGDSPQHSFSLVKLEAFPIADLCIDLFFGGNQVAPATIASGFGLGYVAFKNQTGSLKTNLNLNIQYLFTDITQGNVQFSILLKMGI